MATQTPAPPPATSVPPPTPDIQATVDAAVSSAIKTQPTQAPSGGQSQSPTSNNRTGLCARTAEIADAIVAATGKRLQRPCRIGPGRHHRPGLKRHETQPNLQPGPLRPQQPAGLSLENNELSSLPADLFADTTKLERLRLGDNNLESLPDDLFAGLTDLQVLDLSENRLTALDENAFADLSGLTRLYLSNNRLSSLPPDLFNPLKSLQILELENNQLAALPPGIFSNLPEIQRLGLDGNPGAPFTLDLSDGAQAESVCSRTAQIVAALEQATRKDCSAIADNDLTDVTELTISNEGLTSLQPGDFKGLTYLESLQLSWHDIKELPTGVFAGLTYLEVLDLSGGAAGNGGLRQLNAQTFTGLENLVELRLSYNRLNELPPDIFAGLPNLRSLWLNNNTLRELPPDVFTGLTSLRSLQLTSNRLREIPDHSFSGLDNLQYLHIGGNPGFPFHNVDPDLVR